MSENSRYREEYDKMIASGDYPEIFKGNWKSDSAQFIRMKKLDEELLSKPLFEYDDDEEDDFGFYDDYNY